MPATPYAKLFVSLNSGALQDEGITAAVSDTVDLSAESTVGWPASGAGAPKWEIYGFPPSFTVPAGWSTDGTTGAYYYTGVTPPQFTLTHWGKYMLRLLVQGGGGDKTDESTAISVPDASGLIDLGKYETTQFNDGWDDDQRANLRVIATGIGVAKAPADAQYLVGAAHADLSAEIVWTSIGTTVAFASTATQPCTFSRTDSGTTNTALTTRTLIALGGTVANGFGVQEVYQAEGAGGTAIDAGSVGFSWVDITGGSEDSKCTIGVRTGGAALASCAEFSGSGSTLIRHATTTNDTLPLLTLRRTTSDAGFGTTGIGASVVFELEDGAGNTDTAASIAVDYLDATSTSEDARFLFRGQVAGSLTDLLSLRGQTMRLHGLAGSGSGVLAIDNNGDVSFAASAAGTANFLEDTATAVTTNGRPIQNLAAQLSFLRAAEAPVKLTHQTAAAGSVVEGLRIRQFIAASGVGTGSEGIYAAYSLPNGSGTETVAVTARAEWTTVIGGGTSKFVVATATAGSLTDRLEVNGTGQITASGYSTAGLLTNNGSGVVSSTSPILLIHGAVPTNLTNAVDTRALAGSVLFQADGIEGLTSSTTDATDSTVLDGLCVQRVPDSGLGAIGIGTGIVIRTLDDGGGGIDIGRLTWTTTNVASATAVMGFHVASAGGLPEVATLSDAGTLTTDGVMQTDAGFDAATATTLPIGGRATRIDLLSAVATGGTGAGIRIHNDAGIRTAGYLAEFGDDSTFAFKSGVDYRGVYDGPVLWATALKTSGYTAAAWDQVLCDPTGGAFQVTIPNGTAALKGRRIGVKNYGTSTNTITLDTSTPNGIQGGTATITTGWGYVEIECIGADGWIIVSRVT